VAVFLTVTLEDWGIRVVCIRPYSGSSGLVIMVFVIAAIVGVPIK